MALVWQEDSGTRSSTIVRLGRRGSSTYGKSYKVFGTNDDSTVHSEANTKITGSLLYWTYPGTTIKLRAESYSVSYLGDKAWQVTIAYERSGIDSADTTPIRRARSFDTSGGTTHITTSPVIGTVTKPLVNQGERRWGPSGENTNVPRQYGVIGADGDRVNGVEIETRGLTWEEVYDVPSSYVTNTYIRSVAAVTKTVNDATFRGFQAGEVFFHGCSGSGQWDNDIGDSPWNLRFRFTASPNAKVSGGTIGALTVGAITNVEKNGHDYLWTVYEKVEDSATSSLLQKPRYVYVTQVYDWGDFSALGIGVS